MSGRAQPPPARRGWAFAQAGLVAASFAMLLAGSNVFFPLAPIYRDDLGLDPLMLSLTFTLYVAVLVVVLLTLARPHLTRHAPRFLVVALAAAIGSDLLLLHAQESTILLGRALAGVAGGLGTGAASALVVAAIGTRGRAVTATGNLTGAVVGVSGSQILVTLLGAQAPRVVFLGHASVVAVLLVAVAGVLWRRRVINNSMLAVVPGRDSWAGVDRSAVHLMAIGAIGWSILSVGVVFGATMFHELDRPLVRALGPVLLLSASAAAQLGSPALARIAPWASGAVAMAAGAASVLTGAWIRADWAAITGFLILGAGVGISYRTALVTLTRGANPARQGALASLYAGGTYTVAAAVVLLVGGIGNATGLVTATASAIAVLAVLAAVSLPSTPRLRDTANTGRPAGEQFPNPTSEPDTYAPLQR